MNSILFALNIETLAQAIRQNIDSEGLEIGNKNHTIDQFADDVVVFLKHPDEGFPLLKSFLKVNGHYSGYKINVMKTQVLTFNYSPSHQIQNAYNFDWNCET